MNELGALCELRAVPFVSTLLNTFLDETTLYLLFALNPGGDLLSAIAREPGQRLDEGKARFFTAAVVHALQKLHALNIIYRDLKPENVGIDSKGYAQLMHFGEAKKAQRSWTLCGTPEYLAPEMILCKGHDRAVDLWALGVLVFELLAGKTPFAADTEMEVYQNVLAASLNFPGSFSGEAVSLIRGLLHVNASKRTGNLLGGFKDVQDAPWFAGLDWDAFSRGDLDSPHKFVTVRPDDTSNYAEFAASADEAVTEADMSGWRPAWGLGQGL
jgi:serine/threonine protein kinase